MVKLISFIRTRPPSFPGYCDPVVVLDENGNHMDAFNGRSTPLPIHPKTLKCWDITFGCVALGMYDGEWKLNSQNIYCIVVNEGKEIPSILPNLSCKYRCVVNNVGVYRGMYEDQADIISSSFTHLTIRPNQWDTFCSLFKADEKVKIEIRGLV